MGRTAGRGAEGDGGGAGEKGRELEIKQEWQAGKGVVEAGRKSAGVWKECLGRVSTE